MSVSTLISKLQLVPTENNNNNLNELPLLPAENNGRNIKYNFNLITIVNLVFYGLLIPFPILISELQPESPSNLKYD
ncbi:17311_t:CDS:2 [Acaulospora colombiana]|uniref:17311_t:CDS:1 n=1 Tax=Acaulospora colombiana TaxID=27376 RepID=A0ACA9K6F8_9GLOM|nr:17311_t:CDS:2 [Acaulospora colombiana]